METQKQIDHLIELAIVQRAELAKIVQELPQLRTFLLNQINATIEDIEPDLRADLVELCDDRTDGKINEVREFFTSAKDEFRTKSNEFFAQLEAATKEKYQELIAEREVTLNFAQDAQDQLKIAAEKAVEKLPEQVSALVEKELARFPRAGEIDQLRKEFAEPRSLNPRGKWKSSETYQKLDLVAYNGDSFISNLNDNKEKPSRTSTAWTLSAARGQGSGMGGITSLNDILGNPSAGIDVVGAEGSNYVRKTLTAGTNVTITESATDITINSSGGGGGISDGDKGDITVSDSGTVWTVDNTVVSNAKLANVATSTIKGRATAGTGSPEDLSGTQTTALLDTFTSTLKGLAPSSGGGTTTFLRADGTWTTPSGGSTEILDATVTNADSVTITKGQVVYAYGATGNRISVKLANNSAESTSSKTFGVVVDASIAANGTGLVRCVGVIDGLNLGSYTDGNSVYLGATAGAITATKPSAPNHLVYVGTIARANAGNGQLYVKIQNGYELDEIHDVQITSAPAAGAVLIRDATNSLWKAATITGTSGQVTVTNADASTTLSLPTAITNLNSLTATAATDLTLNGGSSGASIVAGQGAAGGVVITPKTTGQILLAQVSNVSGARVEIRSDTTNVLALNSIGTFGAKMTFTNIGADTFGIGMPANTGALSFYSSSTVERLRITDTGNLLIGGTTDITGSGGLKVFGTTAASSTTTGALQVAGGVGVAGAGYFGGNLTFGTSGSVLNGTTGNIGLTATGTNQNIFLTPSGTGYVSVNANTSSAGLLLVSNSNTAGYTQMVVRNSVAAGGTYGITLQAVSWSNAQEIQGSGQLTLSTNGGTAALTLDTSQNATFAKKIAFTAQTTGTTLIDLQSTDDAGIAGFGGTTKITLGSNLILTASNVGRVLAGATEIFRWGSGVVNIYPTTASTSTSTGALVVSGGVGVAGAGYFGQNIETASFFRSTSPNGTESSLNLTQSGQRSWKWRIPASSTSIVLTDASGSFDAFTFTGSATGTATLAYTTASTSTSTGALVVSGGAGFGGKVSTIASATGTAGLNLPHGAAPTSPVNGDLWTTTGGLYAQINGSTVGPYGTGGSGGSGTVTSVSVVTNAGVSGSVATATTTPAITLTLGAITPTSVNSVVLSGTSTPTLAVTGTSTISGTHSGASSGTNTGDQTITLTGDVTGTGTGSFAATIGNTTVTNAKLANVATATIKGRTTAGTGSPEDLTGTQATALLDAFTTSLKGLAPASGGGTSNFLRADGSWAAPSGGSGTVTSSGTPTSGQFAKFTTATDITGVIATGTGNVVLATTPTITTPNLSGIVVSDGANVNTANAMGALAIDVTKGLNTKSVAADSTFTFSATPATSNTFFSMFVTNTDTASHVLTIPSSYSIAAAATITTCTIPASGKLHLTWRYDGTTYFIYGDPVTAGAGTVTSSGSPVSGNIAQFTSATNISPATVTGTGSVVLATSPTISGLTLSGTTNTSGVIDTTDTTQSTSSTTGSIITDGGIGAAKNITSGGTISGTNLGTTTAYRLIGRQVINAGTTTYTSSAGVTRILARMIAAGGGGGGGTAAASQIGTGGGGGGGSYAEKFFTVAASTGYTCAVGTGGSAGSAGAGGTGGSTTLTVGATTVTCNGGTGGANLNTGTAAGLADGGSGGAISTNGDVNVQGAPGGYAWRSSGTLGTSGAGGNGWMGVGGGDCQTQVANANGITGGFGAGGSGGISTAGTARTGGVGGAGLIVIEEYGI